MSVRTWLAVWWIGCEPAALADADTAPAVDTGAAVADATPRGPGSHAVQTADHPLTSFPLDGSLPYDGPLPAAPSAPSPAPNRFAVEAHLTPDDGAWRLDVGLAAGPGAVAVHDVGVRLAFNPTAVRQHRLRGALGRGHSADVIRAPRLAPGAAVGATFDLWPAAPVDRAGEPRRYRNFLGTVTVSWTEGGAPHEQIIVLERDALSEAG